MLCQSISVVTTQDIEIFCKDRSNCVTEMYEFSGEEMTSTSHKADHVGGDQRESDLLSSIEDKHYNLIDERGDHGTSNKLNAQDITKELIAKESGRSISQSDSQSSAQSSCMISTIMSTGDNRDDDSKIKSTESSDSEMISIDEGNCCIIRTLNIYCKV